MKQLEMTEGQSLVGNLRVSEPPSDDATPRTAEAGSELEHDVGLCLAQMLSPQLAHQFHVPSLPCLAA
jgi:hypothetical protein